ncbi:MAG: hypothetical protein IPG34_07540 [Rhodocyclaceae bacterium]|nr:hypothetical protein [Rhodocyclaceae bacterium]
MSPRRGRISRQERFLHSGPLELARAVAPVRRADWLRAMHGRRLGRAGAWGKQDAR